MKANLKGLDFKQLAIAHGEKAGLGVVALFSLLAVTGMTRWATYQEKAPQDLINQVAVEKSAFEQSQWPEEERQAYAVRHTVTESAQRMLADVDVKHFTYRPGQRIIHSLYKYQEPIREPEWETVDEPIATLVRLPIQVMPTGTTDSEQPLELDAARPGATGDPDTPAALRRRQPGGAAGSGIAGFGGPGSGYPAGMGTAGGQAAIPLGAPGGHAAGGGRFRMDDYEMPGDYDEYGMGGYGGNAFEVEGVRFVAVRAVFPYRRQLQKIMDALNDPDRVPSDPHQLIDIIDFELQRQAAQPGADPWTGPWETITAEKAKEVLARATDWDQEVVVLSITDPVITCPLPYRVMGEWDLEATHPKVKDFKLTEEGRQFQELVQERLLQWQEEQQRLQQQSQQLRKGGFADIARDARRATMRFGSMGGGVGGAGFGSEFGRLFSAQPGGATTDQALMKELQQQLEYAVNAGAGSHFLLFRFFDYTVVPGNVYRYQVRLELANPNFGKSPDEAVDPSVVEGLTRRTQWSQPTPPVFVEPDAEYYLARTKAVGRSEQAALDIFQWLPTVGTLTKGTLEINPGQFIGGKKKETLVVVPEQRVGREEVEFETGDMLVDISVGSRNLDLSEHSALGLRTRQLTLGDQALVVNEAGELVALNPLKNSSQRAKAENWVSSVRELYKDLEQQGRMPGLDMEGMEGMDGDFYELMMQGMMYDEEMMPGGADRGARQRRGRGAGGRNPLRR